MTDELTARRARRGKLNLSTKSKIPEDTDNYKLVKFIQLIGGIEWRVSAPGGDISGFSLGSADEVLQKIARTLARLKNPADPLRWKSASARLYAQLKEEGKRA